MEIGTLIISSFLSLCALSTNAVRKPAEKNVVGTLSEVTAFFDANISSMRLAYEREFNKEWDVNKIERTAYLFEKQSEEQLGYVVKFDVGYLSYSFDMSIYAFDAENELTVTLDKYYLENGYIGYFDNDVFLPLIKTSKPENSDAKSVGSDDPMAKISAVTSFNQFQIGDCLSPIPYLQEHYPSVQYGNYLPLCTEQQGATCAPRALTNLFCGYKASGYADFMMGFSIDDIYGWIHDKMKCDDAHGTSNKNIKPAMNDCVTMGSKGTWWVAAGQNDNYPSLETFNKGDWGHAIVGIGNANSVYWWIFKTYWRIVVSWKQNFDESNFYWKPSDTGIYVIDAQYETNAWTILPIK